VRGNVKMMMDVGRFERTLARLRAQSAIWNARASGIVSNSIAREFN